MARSSSELLLPGNAQRPTDYLSKGQWLLYLASHRLNSGKVRSPARSLYGVSATKSGASMAVPERFNVLSELRPWLLGRAQKMSYDRPEAAEDLVQEVLAKFMDAFQAKPLPAEPEGCMAWLATAHRNEFISRLRKERVRNRVQHQTNGNEEVEVEWVAPPDSFDRLRYETVTDEELKRAMGCLTQKQQVVIE